MAALVAQVMRVFFVDGVSNFTKGFQIHKPDGGFQMLRATFKGWLADEKALKEFNDIKGQAGTKPCISCQNVFNFIHKKKTETMDHIRSGSIALIVRDTSPTQTRAS